MSQPLWENPALRLPGYEGLLLVGEVAEQPAEAEGAGGAAAPASRDTEKIALIAGALAWIGTPYQFGGIDRSGADCSGFLYSLLYSAMPDRGPFPRKSDDFVAIGVRAEAIEPGDILLFAENGDIYHVGLTLSATSFIHAASEGPQTGVIISSLQEGSWRFRLYGIRRPE